MFKSIIKNPHYEQINDIEPTELFQALGDQQLKSQIQVVDVRSAAEYVDELGHISEAELIVLDTIPDHLDKFNKDKTLVLVCRSGGRSARASAFLQEQGFKTIYNMRGGMLLWNQLQLPTQR